MEKIKYHFYILILISILVSPAQSFGFVPQAENIIHQMLVKNSASLTWFKVPEARVEYINDEKSVAMDMELYYSSTGVFRAETYFSDQTKIYMESPGKAVTIQSEEIIAENISEYYLFKDVFLYGDYEEVISLLKKRGCDTENVRLGRKDGKIFYVIGKALPESEAGAELWIDRESFLPYYYKIIKNGENFSFRYYQWIKSGPLKYSGIVEIYHDETLVRKIEARFLDPDFRPENSDFFDIEKLIEFYNKTKNDIGDELNNRVDSIEKIFQ